MIGKAILLLIENDQSVREALIRALATEEFVVLPACSGREALFHYTKSPINIVFLDLNLGQEDGWAVFDSLKDLQPDLPIVVTSAQVERLAHPSAVRAAGALEKPYDISALVTLLNRASLVRKSADFKPVSSRAAAA